MTKERVNPYELEQRYWKSLWYTPSKTLEIPAVYLGIQPYDGFPSFAIPYCYTPNQLFNVVLRGIKDRGVIRLVSYRMYRQIRTGDRDGNPM